MALKAFKTPAAASETEFVVNKSRFIGRAFPVETEAEALEILERIRQKHYDATHNCWAYNLRGASPLRRFSDDGEPAEPPECRLWTRLSEAKQKTRSSL